MIVEHFRDSPRPDNSVVRSDIADTIYGIDDYQSSVLRYTSNVLRPMNFMFIPHLNKITYLTNFRYFVLWYLIYIVALKWLRSFRDKLHNEFPCIKKVLTKNVRDVQCIVRLSTFSVSQGGKSDTVLADRSCKSSSRKTCAEEGVFFYGLRLGANSALRSRECIEVRIEIIIISNGFPRESLRAQ